MGTDPAEFRARVGANIRRARDAKGLSQAALARQLSAPTEARDVSRWELGKNMPSWANLHGLAAALDVTVAELVAEPDDTPSNGE